VTGFFDHGELAMLERIAPDVPAEDTGASLRYRLWQVRADRVVIATGAIERPLVFPGNDRPGIMLASAMRAYVLRYGTLPGTRVVLFCNNDAAWHTAEVMAAAGVMVAAVVDERPVVSSDLAERFVERGVAVHLGAAIIATRGYRAVRSARIRTADGREIDLACDCIAMSGGYSPTLHLFGQSGGQLRFSPESGSFIPANGPDCVSCVGAAAGDGLCDGEMPLTLPNGRGKALVDFQNDVTRADIAQAEREGYRSVEHLKRYTTLGMAPDQGKTANVNALRIMAALREHTPAETGTTRFRFPYTPMPLASFAGADRGELFRPLRRLPAHSRHVVAGAQFEEMGGFLRPTGYPLPGEDRAATEQREARALRAGAGLFDGSPLGKIEVVGPDAATFLDRIYANRVSNLAVGRVRYGLMLDERGTVIDDGVVARLAPDRFLISTTSAGASRIADWLEEWLQCEWTGLDVVVAPVTSAWAVLTLTGPTAREILRAAGTSIDLATDAFPHMGWREGEVAGVAARVQRVSFTGELSYEVAIAPSRAKALWDLLMAAGRDHGIVPVGVDAWMILRTEKGYLHVGSDTDGTTSPLDIGWGHVLKKASDFVGRRSLLLPELQREDRHQFVGLSATDGGVLPVGAHVLDVTGASDGYVTSSAFSPTLRRGVALGMVRAGRARMGEILTIRTLSGLQKATVVEPCAFDPQGERLNA
jgi:sarcosine oxidase subunit alpha